MHEWVTLLLYTCPGSTAWLINNLLQHSRGHRKCHSGQNTCGKPQTVFLLCDPALVYAQRFITDHWPNYMTCVYQLSSWLWLKRLSFRGPEKTPTLIVNSTHRHVFIHHYDDVLCNCVERKMVTAVSMATKHFRVSVFTVSSKKRT